MKNAIKFIIAQWILFYFILCFIFMSFDLKESTVDQRFFAVFLLLIFNVATIGACLNKDDF